LNGGLPLERGSLRRSARRGAAVLETGTHHRTAVAAVGLAASRPVRRILYGPRSVVAIHLGRRLPDGSSGLPGGLCRAGSPSPARPCSWWGLQSHPGHPGCWCALTAPFHPYLCAGPEGSRAIGGLLSVALSCGSPRLGVTQHHALWSPDVPRTGCEHRGTRSPGQLAAVNRIRPRIRCRVSHLCGG